MTASAAGAAASPGVLEDASALRSFALELTAAARPIALRHFRQKLSVERKSDDSPVTVADRSIEAALRDLLAQRFPKHAVFGEEHGAERLGARYTWVLDPIDGTKSFITGMPLFGTLVALLDDGVPVLGVIDMPALGESWIGQSGRPAEFNGVACRTSGRTGPAECVLYATSLDGFDESSRRAFEAVSRSIRLRRFGGDCYTYGLLASGHVDLVVEVGLQPYDYLPLVPIIEGAGGVITDWNGRPLGLDSDGRVVAAASPALHRWVLDTIAQA